MRLFPAPFSLTRLIQSMYLSTNRMLLSQAVTARNTTGPLCAFGCEIPAANRSPAASANLKLMRFMTPPLLSCLKYRPANRVCRAASGNDLYEQGKQRFELAAGL